MWDLRDFDKNGFSIIPDFVNPDKCVELKERSLQMAEEFDPKTTGASVFSTTEQTHSQDKYFLDSANTISCFLEKDSIDEAGNLLVQKECAINKIGHAQHDLDKTFQEFSYTADIADLLEKLGFEHPLALQSMYIFKAPGTGAEVVPHIDHSFLWTDPPGVVGLWFAIDDSNIENGCLWALPGGHTTIKAKTRFRREGPGTITEVLDSSPYPEDGFVPLEVKRGSLIVLNGMLPHKSYHNNSPRSRHAYTLHFIEANANYPADNWLQREADFPLRDIFEFLKARQAAN